MLNKKQLRGLVPNAVYRQAERLGQSVRDRPRRNPGGFIAKDESWLAQQPHLMAQLDRLRGRHLNCRYVLPICHGNVLLRLANAPSCGATESAITNSMNRWFARACSDPEIGGANAAADRSIVMPAEVRAVQPRRWRRAARG